MLHVSLQDTAFQVSPVANNVQVNGVPSLVQWTQLDAHTWVGEQGAQKWRLLLLGHDAQAATVRVQLNGKVMTLKYETLGQRLMQAIGIDPKASQKVTELKAPMPGLIKQIPVEVGQQLEKGDALLVLEAMKMENVIKAPAPVQVSEICVKLGDAVEKNQVLLRFA